MFQEDYQAKLHKITHTVCSTSHKIAMLSALIQQVRANITEPEKEHKHTSQTEDTLHTYSNSDMSPDLGQHIADLENKIILKRDVKIILNEEIDDAEEELESVEKIVFLRQQLDDDLKRKIDMKMMEIEFRAYQERNKETDKSRVNKTFSSFSRKVLNFFN